MEPSTQAILVEISKNWVDYAAALLLPTIALLGAVITFLQWYTNRKRLKHELFDRRYKQFEAIRDFLGSVMSSGRIAASAEQDYLIGTRGVRFIFDEEIDRYVNEKIWCLAVELQALESMLEGLPVGKERSSNVQQQRVIKDKLQSELRNIEKKFSKYLQLGH